MNSFKFSTRHLLIAIAAAAFIFWLVKNYYDSKQLAEAQAQLRAARIAGSAYLYEQLLSDENVIGKSIDEYPGLNELSINPNKLDDRELAEWALEEGQIVCGEMVRSAPTTPTQTPPAHKAGAKGDGSNAQQAPAITYVRGDRALYFAHIDIIILTEGEAHVGFWLYIRNGKILAISDDVIRSGNLLKSQ
jgi:type II secretory pathway pseudopilin PulG